METTIKLLRREKYTGSFITKEIPKGLICSLYSPIFFMDKSGHIFGRKLLSTKMEEVYITRRAKVEKCAFML